MVEPKRSSMPLTGQLINILLASLKKVMGSSYERLLEPTPWRRYIKQPPPIDQLTAESNVEEQSLVFAHIYQEVGKDLFISFGHFAAMESGRLFATALSPAIAPALIGLSGVARLQRNAELNMQYLGDDSPLSLSNIPTGVEIVSHSCGMCSRIKSDEPICGFIGEGLKRGFTLIGGEPVVVQEVTCRAQGTGSDCVFRLTLRA